jgi:hypothetical protein
MEPLRPRALIILLAVTAMLVTGCGSAASSSSTSGTAADAVPAGALFYADVNLDRGSNAWKQFTAVGQRFPSWQRLARELVRKLDKGSNGTTFSADIQPWLGGSAAVALTGVSSSGPSVVGFVASTDDGAAKSALENAEDTTSDGTYKGYAQFRTKDARAAAGKGAVLFANDEASLHAAIDAREGDAPSLADDTAFSAALSALPADSMVRGWVNAPKIAQLTSLASLGSVGNGVDASQLQQAAKSLDRLSSASFAFWATDGGYHATFRATARDTGSGVLDGISFSSGLSDLVPSDAYGYLAFKGSDQQVKDGLNGNPTLDALERQTGISVTRDVLPLFTGEGLFYAGPGLPFRGALMLDPSDPQAAKGALTRLVTSATRLDKNLRVRDLPGGGQQIELSPGFSLFWHQVPGGPLVLGNDEAAGTAPASKLLDSSTYQAFLQKAGVGDATVNFYLDLPSIIAGFGAQGAPDLPPDVRPLGGIAVWSTMSGSTATANLFVEIKG